MAKPPLLIPPLNFSLVAEGVYRSGHPIEVNYPFVARLGLKTIVYLGTRTEQDNAQYAKWACDNGIKLVSFVCPSVKEPFIENSPEAITAALHILVDTRNHPILLHSDKGKHRVGVLVGVMRKMLLGWSLATIFDEYSRYANGKGEADVEFIELFTPVLNVDLKHAPRWLRQD